MNGFTRTPSRMRAGQLLWLGAAFLGLGLVSSPRAIASAIHHADKADKADKAAAATDAGMNQSWSEYLMGGPTVWSKVAHPGLSAAIESEMWKAIKSDPPPDTDAVVQFFLYKQSLDPARFDHYHPRVAASLAKIKSEAATAGATPTTSTSSTGSTPPGQGAQTLGSGPSSPNVSETPEPGALLLAIGMAGYAIWWRRRNA
jgi:hypothetical protein